MANFLINSAGLTTTGTDNAELFLVQSAAVSASTIVGKAGNDTIQMLQGVASADKVSIVAEGGADLIQVSSTVFDEKSVFKGGAGGDTVTFSAGGVEGTISLGAGSDLVQLNAGAELATVNFGAGADRLSAAVAISAENAVFGLGSGRDTVTLTEDGILRGASINMGGGGDLVDISANAGNNTALTIAGGAGGDTIKFALLDEEVIIQGGNGSDVITQSADELNLSSQVLGGAGADNITIIDASAAGGANLLVGGGAGKDTLHFALSGTNGSDISVVGGGGADSINIAVGAATLQGADSTAGTVFGGAGADSITFSAQVVSGVATQIGISNFSDSTLSATDIVKFDMSGAEALSGVGGTLDFVTDGLGTNLAAGGTLVDTKITIGGSIVTNFTSTLSDLTARVAAIDSLASTKGTVVAFMDTGADTGSAAYLFIQGGATDTLVEINELAALSGIQSVTVGSNSALSITFKDNG